MKIEWKKIEMEDRAMVESYYEYEQSNCCEFAFANNYLWSPFYNADYAVVKDMLVFRSNFYQMSVGFPMARNDEGRKNLKEVMLILEKYFEQENCEFRMHFITEEKFACLEEIFPGKYQVEYEGNGAAGDKAVRYIKYGELDKIR